MASSEHVSSLYLSKDRKKDAENATKTSDENLECLVCHQLIKPEDNDQTVAISYQKHLLTNHNLMIADIDAIVDLKTYCDFYRQKFAESPDWTQLCAAIATNSRPNDVSQSQLYYMIGGNATIFPEDTELRQEIKETHLKSILKQLQFERNDTQFKRSCIFCRKVFEGNKRILFAHLTNDHNFNVGNPDNIVNCMQLLDLLEEKLNKFECLYCQKIFKSWDVLKEHMRKKGHKQLHPDNKLYDKFYVINYSSDEDWRQLKLESDYDLDNTCDEEWNDWSEETADQHCICLFCPKVCPELSALKSHLSGIHGFEFEANVLSLDFYSRIKSINYIRRSIHSKRCHKCGQTFSKSDELLVHLDFSEHSKQMPDRSEYDSPEYYFPTFEDDNLLHLLDDTSECVTAETNSETDVK